MNNTQFFLRCPSMIISSVGFRERQRSTPSLCITFVAPFQASLMTNHLFVFLSLPPRSSHKVGYQAAAPLLKPQDREVGIESSCSGQSSFFLRLSCSQVPQALSGGLMDTQTLSDALTIHLYTH